MRIIVSILLLLFSSCTKAQVVKLAPFIKSAGAVNTTFTTVILDTNNVHYTDGFQVPYTSTDGVSYYKHSVNSRVKLTTNDSYIEVEGMSDHEASPYASLIVAYLHVNGKFYRTVSVTQYGQKEWVTVPIDTLPGTIRTIELVKPDEVYYPVGDNALKGGGVINRVRYGDQHTTAIVPPAPKTNKIVVYGNSIAEGAGATPISTHGWAMKLRDSFLLSNDWDLQIDAVSGWRLAFDTRGAFNVLDNTKIANKTEALIKQCNAPGRNVIIIELGVNDWYNYLGTANFQESIEELVEEIHATRPDIEIVYQTILYTLSEAGDGPIENYREAMRDAAAAVTPSAIIVEGATLVDNTGDLSDGLHPTTNGHSKMMNRYWTALEDYLLP